jgi:hypothetical protein
MESNVKILGKYIFKKITSTAISKAIKYGLGGIICYFGPVATVTTILSTGPVGVVAAGSVLGVVYGTNVVENKLSKMLIS